MAGIIDDGPIRLLGLGRKRTQRFEKLVAGEIVGERDDLEIQPLQRVRDQAGIARRVIERMRPFNFNTAAELFPAAIRKKKRAGFAYRRFGTAAEAVRFAIEELPADSLNGAYLQVEEARFDQSGIRTLYESEAFPLPRRPRPAASTDDKADAA